VIEKDNCSVDNHCVVCIFFLSHNWRRVEFSKEGGGNDETILNECDKWIFLGDIMSKGKKNDHVFHQACLTYLIKRFDAQRVANGKVPIQQNIVWTDNCPNQYRCRQNFLSVAKAASYRNHTSIIVHKFAQKYRFKGPWDGTGKLTQTILNNELKYERYSVAF